MANGRATAALVALIAGGWYYTRPPSADQLFVRIQDYAAAGDPERLLDAEDDIRRFLERYPDDPAQAPSDRLCAGPQGREGKAAAASCATRSAARRACSRSSETTSLRWAPPTKILNEPPRNSAIITLDDDSDPANSAAENREAVQNCLDLARQQLKRLDAEIAASWPASKAAGLTSD